eukprot:1806998-Amphidinium_carterae.1
MSGSRASIPLIPQQDDIVSALRLRLSQQQLPAKFISLTRGTVISLIQATAFLFLGIGVALLLCSRNIVEHVVDYTDLSNSQDSATYFDIQVNEDMHPPIWIYYELDGFHQNH